jgi:hypothetical protein
MILTDLTGQLAGVKKVGDQQWQARCPAHDDSNPSLSVSIGGDGTILLKCHAGCTLKDICRALKIEVKDLFPKKKATGEPAVVYDYQDEFGRVLFQVCRFPGKRFRQRCSNGNGGYTWNLNGVRRVLYHLPELTAATPNKYVFVVEGEKDADRLTKLGLLATCNSGGAGKWRADYNRYLSGRSVVILPDNDDPGRSHAQQVARALANVAKEIRIVSLDDLPVGGDVSDWFETDGNLDQLMLRVKQAAPLGQLQLSKPIIKRLVDVRTRKVERLWPNKIPSGKLTLLVGDPCLGKSFLTLYIASRVTNGLCWPDLPDEPTPKGSVVILSAEDDLSDTVVPRLSAHDADLNRITAIEGVTRQDRKFHFNLVRDLPALEQAVDETEGVRLIVIDPITAYLGATDSHKNAEVRGVLAPLSQLAAKRGVAVLGVSHLRKGEGKALYRVLGSLAFVAAARALWMVSRDAENATRRLLVPAKCNLAIQPTSLAFSIIDGVVCFEANPVNITADEALRTPDESERCAMTEAVQWLQGVLGDGRVKAGDIFKSAKINHISEITLRRAAEKIGVLKSREGFGAFGGWYWQLPEDI